MSAGSASKPSGRDPVLSVVVPLCNEEACLPELYRRTVDVLEQVAPDYELIFVNDGSVDGSWALLQGLHASNPKVIALDLSRNFGHQAAITAGLRCAAGQAVVCMDGDLQDPPELIPDMLERWREGWQVVYAIREKRKEGLLKRLTYLVFYRMLRSLAEISIPVDSGDFALMDRQVVREIRVMPERHRFVRGLRAWAGFSQIGIPCERGRRFAGSAQYGLGKLVRLALDGLFAFSIAPLRLATVVGVLVSLLSFVGIVVVVWLKVATNNVVPGWAATVIPVLFLGGVQLLTVGILGEYVGRIFDEVKRRPPYIIRRSLVGDARREPVVMSADTSS